MLNFCFTLIISAALGFLAGLGVGGGSLLLLWLTQVAGVSQDQARIINLLFYLPAALISILLRSKKKQPDKHLVIPGILAGCFSAILFSVLSRYMDRELLKKILGGLLILVGLREVFYRPRNAR